MIPRQLLSIVFGEKENMGILKLMSYDGIKDLIKESIKRNSQFLTDVCSSKTCP
ncbi:unnamed protein product [Paramecium octaurelia]|uniref:Uncharacterized protein n=1 Tax=Paramecium octaurelia TaxID=43137 RepID=A0A8S1X9L4_PAROT|nr:unnamed protein product [Paramecium octaurelia]